MIEITAILALFAFAYLVHFFVLNGQDMQLIFVKVIGFILLLIVFSIILAKLVSPTNVNNENVALVFGLIKDLSLLVVGYLFAKNNNNNNLN